MGYVGWQISLAEGESFQSMNNFRAFIELGMCVAVFHTDAPPCSGAMHGVDKNPLGAPLRRIYRKALQEQ
jgi:hypothetical protein